MTDREKLLDILMDNLPDDNPWEGAVKTLLDRLIANGVVVREKGEWLVDGRTGMSFCSVCQVDAVEADTDFCPNCGADMTGGDLDV